MAGAEEPDWYGIPVWPIIKVEWIDPPNDANYGLTGEILWSRRWGPEPDWPTDFGPLFGYTVYRNDQPTL